MGASRTAVIVREEEDVVEVEVEGLGRCLGGG